MKHNYGILAIALTSLLVGCAPKMTYSIATGTELILPFGGSAEWIEVEGKIGSGKFEGKFGVIKVSGGNLFYKTSSGWEMYPDLIQFYTIELKEDGFYFDGKLRKPTKTIPETEI